MKRSSKRFQFPGYRQVSLDHLEKGGRVGGWKGGGSNVNFVNVK
jgi:hypothetical protein